MIAFIDTETLGLDPDLHAVWELALVLYDEERREITAELTWQILLTDEQIAAGDPEGMEIGGFNTRYDTSWAKPPAIVLGEFVRMLPKGTHLAGNVVSFDEERLRRLCQRHGIEWPWHYHLIDVENMVIGWLHGRRYAIIDHLSSDEQVRLDRRTEVATSLPWKSDALTEALGLPPVPGIDRHTAMGDALWALAMWEAVTGG